MDKAAEWLLTHGFREIPIQRKKEDDMSVVYAHLDDVRGDPSALWYGPNDMKRETEQELFAVSLTIN